MAQNRKTSVITPSDPKTRDTLEGFMKRTEVLNVLTEGAEDGKRSTIKVGYIQSGIKPPPGDRK